MANVEVLCDVRNCVHNVAGIRCGAEQIKIMSETGKAAHTTAETDCQTFEPHVQ